MFCIYAVMTSKLTVYVDDSLKRLIKETSGNRKISEIVSEALEYYLSASSISYFKVPGGSKKPNSVATGELPSLSEVKKRRPKATGSSAEIIASQRRDRKEKC